MSNSTVSTFYNNDLPEMEDQFALAFINRLPDQKTVATMAPIGTDIRQAPKTANRNDDFRNYFQSCYEPNWQSSLEMGFDFADFDMNTQFAGSSTALKKLFMEPYRAGPLSLFCHRVGKTIYVDLDDQIASESFKEKVQDFNENQGYVPSYPVCPGLTLYENLIWNCKETSDVWREHMGICPTTELTLDLSKSALTPMFDSYSYKIHPQNSLNGEAYIWEFHNTKMLVDSELPIFGGGTYPALTIRLSEGTGMPISVLTGVDILLDQLMHHIKETIVVHHVEGSVKKYDVVVQNKIPYLEGSEFDPLKLKNITSNMYNFLNSNMTQQGHTYWLCRETNSDEIRLYDLTAICPEQARSRHKNPFLIPVVNLMYKIACKLITETVEYRSTKVTNVAWGLLTAADKLLEQAHVPEFRACINYMLAGIYLSHHTSKKKTSEVNQDDLLKGLSEEMFKGYEKFPGIIKVDDLIEETCGSADDENEPPPPLNYPIFRIPNCKLKVDCANQALDYCREALTCLEKCRHDDEDIPYVADNYDDMSAFAEHDHVTEDTVFNHLRHALLIRAATCYLILSTQAALLNKGLKMYKFAQAGLQCCTSVMSSYPTKRHEIATKVLIPPLCACFVKAMHFFTTGITDLSVLVQSYRDTEIMKIASEHINVQEKYNFARSWTFRSNTVSFSCWTKKVDQVIFKFIPLLQEDFSGKKKLTYKPLTEAVFCHYEAASKIAQVLTELGALIIRGVQSKMKEKGAEEIASFFDGTPEMTVNSAIHFYDKSIEIIEMCPDTDNFNRVKSILLINSVIAKKVWMLVGRAKKFGFLEQNRLAEDVLTVYHKAFSYMPKELRTTDGIDIHVRCLIEYTDVLMMFTSEHSKDLDQHFPGRRKTFFETCIRHYDTVLKNHKGVPVDCLSELAICKTHILYRLLKIKAEELNISAVSENVRSLATSKKIRKAVNNYMNFFEKCLSHVESLIDMKVWDSARRPEPHFCNDIVPCFTSPHLTGQDKIRILRLTSSWARALLEIAPLTTPDDVKAAKDYAIRGIVELKSIASGMRTVVDKGSEKKLELVSNCLVLKHAPKDEKALINLVRQKLAEAIKLMS